jgi:hypothetical protein
LAGRGAAADGGWRSGRSRRRRDHRRRSGRGYRQLAALDPQGGTAGFTGDASVAYAAHVAGDGMIVAGNMLSGPEVLDAMREGWTRIGRDDPAARAGGAARGGTSGGDARGLLSAALLVLRPDAATARFAHRPERRRPSTILGDLLARGADTALCRLAGRRAGPELARTGRRTKPRAAEEAILRAAMKRRITAPPAAASSLRRLPCESA